VRKTKKILILTDGNINHASSRIRAIQYIPNFEKEGYEITWIPRIPEKKINITKIFFPLQKRFLTIKRNLFLYFNPYHIVFIQRKIISENLLQRQKKKKAKIIFDFDDAIYINEKDKNAESKIRKVIENSDYIIVSNQFLKDFTEKYNKNVIIVTTPIDTEIIKPNTGKSLTEEIKIGWIGSSWTTKYLSIIEKPLADLSENYKIKLILIGANNSYHPAGINYQHFKWTYKDESKLLQMIDVGVMPLTNEEYSKAKGGYKILQYMAAGIPTIASPIGINTEIIEQGVTGLLATTQEDWKNSFLLFIKNKQLILDYGKNARNIAVSKYSRDICYEKIKKFLE